MYELKSLTSYGKENNNTKYSNSWAVGFSDTTQALDDFARQLRERNQAALWYHPQSTSASVLVAYATGPSSGWDFLDIGGRFPENITLKIVARSSLPPMASLPSPPSVLSRPVIMNDQVDRNIMQSEDPTTENAPVDAPVKENLKLMKIVAEALAGDIARVFREHFEITYNELAEVNTFDKTNRHAHAFYLVFPDHVKAEYELMVLFLQKYKTLIYSNRNEDDWDKFSRTIKSGTILVSILFFFTFFKKSTDAR